VFPPTWHATTIAANAALSAAREPS